MQPLFADKRGLITGVFNKQSIAWAIAERIMEEGGTCGFSYMPDKPDDERKKNLGRVTKLTEGNPRAAFLHPMDVTNDAHIDALMATAREMIGGLDFLLHSIAFALPDDLKRDTVETSRDGFKLAMEISAFSLIALARSAREILNEGASILTLTYYGGERPVPGYNVMGICKAALDCSMKYLAYDLGPRGIRVNALSAGPLRTLAARAVGSDDMHTLYEQIAPSGKNISHDDVARTGAFLLSDMSEGITGEILHVDGGYNIMGSPGRMLEKIKGMGNA
jgi:enoyl-[acyl-carrier protein] reductase I